MLVKFIGYDDKPIWINTRHIVCLLQDRDTIMIIVVVGEDIYVKGDLDAVAKSILGDT